MVTSLLRTPSIKKLNSERVTVDGKEYGKISGTAYYWMTVGNFGRRGGFQAIESGSFKFLPYQLSMVGYWPTMVATGDGELGFDSGEGA